ncbi:ankyrin repeat-containing domain protein [Lasiosphaeris hirsuta]|uniref:Ankyrin repeat-containing domain protein n=1 Tax=Lasiosphaeris hirsuta TaxID=260670 RepID=A0AA40B0N1_9PEZI|nr:ankyrin repeat-containing domain protein [Lasiosphaeris hirsuta]
MLLDLESPKVDIDATGGRYCNALQAAAFHGRKEVVELLLDRGANPHITGGRFSSPLCAAAFSLHTDVVIFEKYTSTRQHRVVRDKGGRTPLHYAVSLNESTDVLDYLIQISPKMPGMDVNTLDSSGLAPLHAAFAEQNHDYITHLLRAGARHPPFDPEGLTLVHFAALNCLHSDHLDLLLEIGPFDANARDISERTPLHLAAYYGGLAVVQWLLDHGADVNAIDDSGRTALHCACQNQTRDATDIIDLLHQRGLSFSARDGGGSTPLHMAFHQPRQPTQRAAFWYNVSVTMYDDFMAAKCRVIVEHVLEIINVEDNKDHAALMNVRDDVGNTVLHLACWRQLEDLAMRIAWNGADISLRDRNGMLPLELIQEDEARKFAEESAELIEIIKKDRKSAAEEGEKRPAIKAAPSDDECAVWTDSEGEDD